MTFDPRRATPGARITYHDRQRGEVTLRADDEGIVRPENELEASIADAYGLPVARKVIAEEKAAAEKPKEPTR